MNAEANRVEGGAAPRAASRDALWILLLGGLGALVLYVTLRQNQGRDCLDTSDEAAYSEQADSILAGNELSIGFIQHHHVRYDADVVHPEDFYPPGNGAVLAAAYRFLGRSEFAATVPSALLASILIPLLAYLIVRRLGAGPPFAFACGAAAMLDPNLREYVARGLADVPLTTFVAIAGWLALGRGRWSAALAGAALAVAFYMKPAGLLFAPGLAILRAVSTRRPLKENAIQVVVMGVGFLAVAGPWLFRNYQMFGDPVYSGNQHITAIANDPGFEYDFNWRVYWADPPVAIPSMGGSIERYGAHAVVTRVLVHVYEAFVSKGGVIFGFLVIAGGLLLLGRRAVLGVVLFVVTFALALSAVFAVEVRYLLPCIPFALAVAWAGIDHVLSSNRLAELLEGFWLRPLARPAPRAAAAILLAGAWTFPTWAAIGRDAAFGAPPFASEGDQGLRAAGEWIAENSPADARVMSHQALRLRYYGRRLSVATPYDTPERMQQVVAHYRIDTLVVTEAGNLSEIARKYIDPYLAAYGDQWDRIGPSDDLRFSVYRRR